MAELVLDICLVIFLLSMAWGALYAPHPGAGIGLFVTFGMVMALIWARLGAADLAFAEAAIGAGLTGVLLLRASRSGSAAGEPSSRGTSSMLISVTFIIAVSTLMTLLLVRGPEAVMDMEPRQPELVNEYLQASGVEHPVTAVLLNFRGWDTVLELMVLLVALLGARQMYYAGETGELGPAPARHEAWPPLLAWARILAPVLVVTGGFILWRGSSAAGGAFQAGSLLAAAAVLLRLTGQLPPLRWSQWPVRLAVALGCVLFLGIALGTYWLGRGWLYFPIAHSKALILLIEAAATLSIAVTLTLLVAGDHDDFRRT